MNVRYIVSEKEIIDTRLDLIDGGADPWVYRNRAGKPRAYVPAKIVWVKNRTEVLRLLAKGKVDLGSTAIVEEGKGKRKTQGEADVSIVSYGDERVEFRVGAARGNILVVLADSYYPGWVARVDGQKREILRVNGRLRGIWVGEEEEEVIFSYRPLSFWVGFRISLPATALLIFILILGRRQRRRAWR